MKRKILMAAVPMLICMLIFSTMTAGAAAITGTTEDASYWYDDFENGVTSVTGYRITPEEYDRGNNDTGVLLSYSTGTGSIFAGVTFDASLFDNGPVIFSYDVSPIATAGDYGTCIYTSLLTNNTAGQVVASLGRLQDGTFRSGKGDTEWATSENGTYELNAGKFYHVEHLLTWDKENGKMTAKASVDGTTLRSYNADFERTKTDDALKTASAFFVRFMLAGDTAKAVIDNVMVCTADKNFATTPEDGTTTVFNTTTVEKEISLIKAGLTAENGSVVSFKKTEVTTPKYTAKKHAFTDLDVTGGVTVNKYFVWDFGTLIPYSASLTD